MKIIRDATFDEHHRLANAPTDQCDELNHREQKGASDSNQDDVGTPSRATVNPTGTSEPMEETTDTIVKTTGLNSDQTLPNVITEDDYQENKPRRSLRGRIPRRQWDALTTLDTHTNIYQQVPDRCDKQS